MLKTYIPKMRQLLQMIIYIKQKLRREHFSNTCRTAVNDFQIDKYDGYTVSNIP